MSQQLFEVSGISLDGAISILYGTDVPGTSQDTIDAPQGSVYFDTAGITWKKDAAGSGIDKWSRDGSGTVSSINALRNVIGNTTVDSLDSTVIDTGVWAITTTSTANTANRQTVVVTGSHNGVIAKYSLYSRIDFGTKIQGITYDVQLNNGKFELVVFAPVQANIDCYRLNAVSNGSTVTLVGSGGGSSGGSGVDLTPQLNAEIAARTAADTALQAAINAKADIAGLTTQFTTINNQIAAEVSARTAADATIQASINAAVAGAISPTQLAAAIAALPADQDPTQVQSDWNATTGVAVILNKPTLVTTSAVNTAISEAIATEAAARQAAINAIPAQVSADWTAVSGVAQILNKPTLVTPTDIANAVAVETTARQAAIAAIPPGFSVIKTFTQTGHGFSVGQALARSSGSWVLASAIDDTNAEVAGIVSAVVDANTFTITMIGYMAGFTGLVDGTTYYLSDATAGGYLAVSPSNANTVSKPIFIAISATEALLIQSRGILN